MKFCVGFKLQDEYEEPFSSIVETFKDKISEVFFAWQDIPSGRSGTATMHGFTDWTAQERVEEELRIIKSMGIKLDLLFNSNCNGAYALSEKLANTVISVIEHLRDRVGGVDIVTTTSLTVAHVIKKRYPDIEVRASVNMRIGTVKGMEYLADLFDSFHVQRDYNRDFDRLKELKTWADANGKKLIMLANSGCFSFCSGQTFHDNLVSHESEISMMDNGYAFEGICHFFLKNEQNIHRLADYTGFIRPEDIYLYEGVFPAIKLATRVNSNPERIFRAYIDNQKYIGSVLDLLEPNHTGTIRPYFLENSLIEARVENNKLNYLLPHYYYTLLNNFYIKIYNTYTY